MKINKSEILLTTTVNSRNLSTQSILVLCRCLLIWVSIVLLVGCTKAQKPEQIFTLSEESDQIRSLQSRLFETSDEKVLLSASVAVLQDLGFQVEGISTAAGFLRAAKERSARELDQELSQVLIFLVALFGKDIAIFPVDLHQQINAVLVTQPYAYDSSRYLVRVQFYRTVWMSDGFISYSAIPPGLKRIEMIQDKTVYQSFFTKLSKSVFLEANQI